MEKWRDGEAKSGGILELALGICALGMVFLAVYYGNARLLTEETAGTEAGGRAVQAEGQRGNDLQTGNDLPSDRPVVVIDAGHGGNDPGKIGVDGSLEKEINLEVAKRLQVYLEQSDVRVVMTRETDRGLYAETDTRKKAADMKNRCALIEESGADLAVSVHQNSYHEENVSGGQVFYYKNSERGKRLAELIQKRFDYVLGDANRRLARANGNYYLLLHAKCPMVIVECGFLSNRGEAARLQTAEYQDKLAWTIHMGILEYLNEVR